MTIDSMNRSKALEDVFDELRNMKAMLADARRTIPHECVHPPLNRAQLDVFFAIIRSRKPVSMKDLTERLHVTPGAITQIIDSLVEQNMVMRHQSEDDRRSVIVELTDDARKRSAAIHKHIAEQLTPMFSDFSVEELQTLKSLLQKLKSN